MEWRELAWMDWEGVAWDGRKCKAGMAEPKENEIE